MSSRVLKKLHGEPELDKKIEAEEILSDIESEKEKKQINNRYDLVSWFSFLFSIWFAVSGWWFSIIAKFVFVLYFFRTSRWKNVLGLQSEVFVNYLKCWCFWLRKRFSFLKHWHGQIFRTFSIVIYRTTMLFSRHFHYPFGILCDRSHLPWFINLRMQQFQFVDSATSHLRVHYTVFTRVYVGYCFKWKWLKLEFLVFAAQRTIIVGKWSQRRR